MDSELMFLTTLPYYYTYLTHFCQSSFSWYLNHILNDCYSSCFFNPLIVSLSPLCVPNYYSSLLPGHFMFKFFSFQLSLDMKPKMFSWKIFILPLPYRKAGETAYCFLNQFLIEVPSTDPETFSVTNPKYWSSPKLIFLLSSHTCHSHICT